MDPVTAFGVASGVVALIEFTLKVLSTTYKFSTSTTGLTDKLLGLEDAATNLQELSDELDKKRWGNISKVDEQLQNLCRESQSISKKLRQTLERLKDKVNVHSGGQPGKWDSFRQALSSLWREKEIRDMEDRLVLIRAQLDTALLVCLSQQIDQIASVLNKHDREIIGESSDGPPEWQVEFLEELRRQRWSVKKSSDVCEFSLQLRKSIMLDNKSRFSGLVRSRLLFEQLTDREEGIRDAHEETLNWFFDGTIAKGGSLVDFSKWLQSEQAGNLYWITGKPGSGKSTLMKYIHRDPRTAQYLSRWCPDDIQLMCAAFFFWNPGSRIQKSREGLLRSLLYQLLFDDPSLAYNIFKERWELYDAYGAGLRPFSWEELRRSFTSIISDSSRRFFFLIDGLDEFDGDHKQLSELVLKAAKLPHVKLCVSSRPWLVFGDSFGGRPSVTMEKGTKDDVSAYVTSKFLESKYYLKLQTQNRDEADRLIQNVTHKSAGVFLWVYLVVNSLLEGFSNSDRISDLQQRLDDLPEELSELFDRLLNSRDPAYYQHASQLILTVEAYKHYEENGDPEMQYNISSKSVLPSALPILLLSFADEENLDSAIKAKIIPVEPDVQEEREENMRRRLNSRCRGLFESRRLNGGQCVAYLHRTAREYVKTPNVWAKLVSEAGASFDANLGLCLGSLIGSKVGVPGFATKEVAMWSSLYHARKLKAKTPSFFAAYLDEIVSSPFFCYEILGCASIVRERGDLQSLLEYAVSLHGKTYRNRRSKSIAQARDT